MTTNTKHTPGPWGWQMNGRGEIRLSTPDRGHLYVMGFARKGMQGATPRFAQWDGERACGNAGWMRDAADFLVDGVLTHPDALLIAAAPELLEALNEINNWLVCACIATPDDMAQSFPHMLEVTQAALAKAGVL